MPKIKTRKSAAKRYHLTGSGKVKFKRQGLRHLLTKKRSRRRSRLRQPAILSKVEERRVKLLLPYG